MSDQTQGKFVRHIVAANAPKKDSPSPLGPGRRHAIQQMRVLRQKWNKTYAEIGRTGALGVKKPKGSQVSRTPLPYIPGKIKEIVPKPLPYDPRRKFPREKLAQKAIPYAMDPRPSLLRAGDDWYRRPTPHKLGGKRR